MNKWKNKRLRKPKTDDTSLRKNDNKKIGLSLNPFAKIKAKKEEKQKEIDRQIELERLEIERKKEEDRLDEMKIKTKKHNIIKLIIGCIALFVSIFLWPILLPISLIALWYFAKKKPNNKFKKYAKNMTIVNALGLVLMFAIAEADDSVDVISDIDTVELIEDVEADKTETTEQLKAEAERKERAQEIIKEREELLAAQKEKREQDRKEREAIAEANPNKTGETEAPNEPVEVPDAKEEVNVNDNIPRFSNQDITSTDVYHRNGPLDSLGRVTAANAVVGDEIMPAKQRGSIGHHEPTGWSQASYANIDYINENVSEEYATRFTRNVNYNPDTTLRKRLKDLFNLLPDDFLKDLIKKPEISTKRSLNELITGLIDTRNYLTHGDDEKKYPKRLSDPHEMYKTHEVLKIVIRFYIYKELDVPEEKALENLYQDVYHIKSIF